MQEGAGKAVKAQQPPPKKAQALMLRTSQRTSDSDEEPYHKRVNFVLALVDLPTEQIKSEQIKTSDSDEEPNDRPNHERC